MAVSLYQFVGEPISELQAELVIVRAAIRAIYTNGQSNSVASHSTQRAILLDLLDTRKAINFALAEGGGSVVDTTYADMST